MVIQTLFRKSLSHMSEITQATFSKIGSNMSCNKMITLLIQAFQNNTNRHLKTIIVLLINRAMPCSQTLEDKSYKATIINLHHRKILTIMQFLTLNSINLG